jgi:hypothetical protein
MPGCMVEGLVEEREQLLNGRVDLRQGPPGRIGKLRNGNWESFTISISQLPNFPIIQFF